MKELNEQTAKDLDQRYKATTVVLFALIATIVILTVVSFLIAGKLQPFGATTGEASFSVENLTNPNAGGGNTTLTTFLWITILALAVAAFLLRRVVFAPAVLRDAATVKGASGLLQNLQSKTFLLAALGEIVAILGFLISLASGDWLDMLRAAAIAAIVLIINFPRKSSWHKLASAASRANP